MTERLRELLREAATDPEPLRPQDIAHRLRHRRRVRAGVASAFGAAAVAAVVAPLTAVHTNGHQTEVVVAGPSTSPNSLSSNGFSIPSSITVSGASIPYVGNIPWADAVTPTADSTTLTIYADGDKAGQCGLPIERVSVRQDADTVVVLVAGYARPLPPGMACAGVGHGPQPLTVDLAAPLGQRHLVDAYDQLTHPLLVGSTVATIPVAPAGYVEQPVQWDQQTGEVTRSWLLKASTEQAQPPSYLYLRRAPAGMIEAQNASSAGTLVASGVPVPGGLARVWSYHNEIGHEFTVLWRGAGGLEYEVDLNTPPDSSLGVAEAEALARSVR